MLIQDFDIFQLNVHFIALKWKRIFNATLKGNSSSTVIHVNIDISM